MPPLRVVKTVNVLADRRDCSCSGRVAFVVDEFSFEGRKEAFRNGVVPAVAATTHARHKVMCGEFFSVILTGIRASTIGMVDQPWRRGSNLQCTVQCSQG